ncbi:MAG: response regulator [Verrucomicrobia bacterium]|jgi:PAS domain S-box-containing protein|nr:response regulator [Verrucomicrobiota bacterium]
MVQLDGEGDPSAESGNGITDDRLHGVFNVLREPVLVIDDTDAIFFANEAFAQLLNVSRRKLVGEPVADWIQPVIGGSRLRRFLERSRAECTAEEICRLDTGEGERKSLLLQARVTPPEEIIGRGLVVLEVSDITEQEELEQRRKEAVALQEGILGQIPVLLCLCTGEGHPYFFNEHWLSYTGKSLVEQLREGIFEHVHADDRERLDESINFAFAEEEKLEIEVRFRNARGKYRWLHLRGLPLETKSGHPGEFALAAVEVDALKSREQSLAAVLEEERLLRNRALEQKAAADRANREKSAYLSLASHEIRTPMNPVIGFADLLASNPKLDGDSKEMAEMILKSGKNLLLLIDEVLDFAKIEAGVLHLTPEPVDVHDLLIELDQQYAFDAKSRGLEWRVKDEVEGNEELYQDRIRLQQALGTLLTHAIKFTHTGHVELKARVDPVEVQGGKVAMLHFIIEDTGVGMGEEEQRILFKPFMQPDMELSEKYSGSGLGLAIAQKVVEAMRGSLVVESELEKGTTFHLTIPFTEVPQEERPSGASKKKQEPEALEGDPPSVIIVDDEESSRHVNSSLLQFLGYNSETVASGEELMARLQKNKYDLILLDVMMPGMDGFQVARRVRKGQMGEENRDAYIIAVTGCVQDEDRRLCLKAGCNAYVPKPLTISNLKNALRGQRSVSGKA